MQMAHGQGIAGFGCRATERVVDRLFLPCEKRGDTESDLAGLKLRKADSIGAATGIGHLQIRFEAANFRDVHSQIAVPIDTVEGNIEVGIEYEHGGSLRWKKMSLADREMRSKTLSCICSWYFCP